MRLYVGRTVNGTPKILTTTGDTKNECKRLMNKRKREYENQIRCDEDFGILTIKNLCEKHLQEHMSQEERLKAKSADRRESTIKNQIAIYAIGGMQVQAVRPRDIELHIEHLIKNTKLSVSSIEKAFDVISSAYKWAISQGYMGTNPCEAVKDSIKHRLRKLEARKSVDADVVILSEDEKKQLVKIAREKDENGEYIYYYGLATLLLLYTGMRVGEMCALRWKDYNRRTNSLAINATRYVAKNHKNTTEGKTYVPGENTVKNDKAREIVLTPEAISVLEEIYVVSLHTKDDDYIILNTKQKPTNPSNFDANLKKIYAAAGFREGIGGAHLLRRTFATGLYDAGADIKAIAAYIGDLESTTSAHYIASRKRIVVGNETRNVVPIPTKK